MTQSLLQTIINNGENNSVEFKRCSTEQNPAVYETMCSTFRKARKVEELGSGRKNSRKYAPYYYRDYKIDIENGEKFVFSITYRNTDGNVKEHLFAIIKALYIQPKQNSHVKALSDYIIPPNLYSLKENKVVCIQRIFK
jgi:predicted HTH transcriptional regulator